jgi:pimeloyl-ACP methyl ester carboxylesterase
MSIQLPIRPETGGTKSEGFCTPKEDKRPQRFVVPPKKVIPIVFLPGIMGSNLRMSQPRQWTLKKKNNIAWRPDRKGEALDLMSVTPAYRQLALDPDATEVDTYDNGRSPTGTRKETSDDRHAIGGLDVDLPFTPKSPLLTDDPATAIPRRSKKDKAKRRGWQEILYSSYRILLEQCESKLNAPDIDDAWKDIATHSPRNWQAADTPVISPLSMNDIKAALSSAWFPVHAMGYNWLESNAISATKIAARIDALIAEYTSNGFHCEKVIVVTHSMGGLVARALAHPEIGGAMEKIQGIVHGVMPSRGAPAAYRRMRCGFEEGLVGWAPAPKVLGNLGPEVTAVLGNSQGGLQLLPSAAYGNSWLKIRQGNNLIRRLPTYGNPYDEIYKLRTEWYRLIREEWLNPAKIQGVNISRTFRYLGVAQKFHEMIADFFHPNTYAHYGSDIDRNSWETIEWNVGEGQLYLGWENLAITEDNQQGRFKLQAEQDKRSIKVSLGPSVGAGDQTVPLRSSDHQRQSGKVKGIFRQSGYEHQDSYKDEAALRSTLYSLVKIIQTMRWNDVS